MSKSKNKRVRVRVKIELPWKKCAMKSLKFDTYFFTCFLYFIFEIIFMQSFSVKTILMQTLLLARLRVFFFNNPIIAKKLRALQNFPVELSRYFLFFSSEGANMPKRSQICLFSTSVARVPIKLSLSRRSGEFIELITWQSHIWFCRLNLPRF